MFPIFRELTEKVVFKSRNFFCNPIVGRRSIVMIDNFSNVTLYKLSTNNAVSSFFDKILLRDFGFLLGVSLILVGILFIDNTRQS